MSVRDAGDGDAGGVAALLAELGYPDEPDRVRARLELVRADPAAESRRAGVGGALVAAVEERARAAGCRYPEVTSGERPGRGAAHAFYAAHGLEQVSRRYLKEL